MSLQSIMDATPIVSWREWQLGENIGSGNKGSYLIAKDSDNYELWYHSAAIDKTERHKYVYAKSVIEKINELEGVE